MAQKIVFYIVKEKEGIFTQNLKISNGVVF